MKPSGRMIFRDDTEREPAQEEVVKIVNKKYKSIVNVTIKACGHLSVNIL